MGAELAIPKDTVVAGDTLLGNLKFKLDSPTSFTNVSLKLVGKESTRPAPGSKKARDQRGHLNVHKQYMTILGGPKGSNFKGELPPGDYDFPFEFQIPLDAPPSLSVGYPERSVVVPGGRVAYHVQGGVSGMVQAKVPVTILSPMPTSQYLTKAPVESTPSHFDRTSCCCIDNGRTEIHVKLSQNIFIFGKDASISGTMFINNSESKASCQNVAVHLAQTVVKKLYALSGESEGTRRYSEHIVTVPVQADVAPMHPDTKQYGFAIPLPCNIRQGGCYHGPSLTAFYELVVTIDGDTAHSMPVLMASGEDLTNRCPPIDMTAPRQAIAPGAYHKSVYPHGQVAAAVMPQQPPAHIPQPTPQRPPANFIPPAQPGAGSASAQADVYGGGGGGGNPQRDIYGSAAPPQQQGDDVYGSGAGGGLYGEHQKRSAAH